MRYHARDGAVKLGALYKIPVILGSATPSAETLHAVQQGEASQSKLPRRAVGEAVLPTIELVDLKKGIPQENKNPSDKPGWAEADGFVGAGIRGDFFLTPELHAELNRTLEDKRQAILFLNRRGLGSQEFCRSCGFVCECPNCDVKLTPHHKAMVCHYCGYEQRSPTTCPECKASDSPFVRVGIGTEAIEEAVKFHYPWARVARLDRDTASTIGEMDTIVEEFRDMKADILIGTQMVAKGHDFPNVTLVGILLGDLGLAVPDFRAHERNLQLLLQVSGRAGRGLHPGKVVVQSFQPEHPVFASLQSQRTLEDYREFMLTEIEKRRTLGYPPHGKLCLLRFDGLDEQNAARAARAVADALKRIDPDKLQVLGPVVCPISKIRARYRWQLLLKSQTSASMQKAVSWILEGWESQKLERRYSARLTVDVDPVSML